MTYVKSVRSNFAVLRQLVKHLRLLPKNSRGPSFVFKKIEKAMISAMNIQHFI